MSEIAAAAIYSSQLFISRSFHPWLVYSLDISNTHFVFVLGDIFNAELLISVAVIHLIVLWSVHCRPSSVKTFIRLGDISTSVGYPLQITGGTRLHLRTLIICRYRRSNELCSAAAAPSHHDRDRRQVSVVGGPSRRRRRQAVPSDAGIMSQELIDTILAYEDKLVRQTTVKPFNDQRRAVFGVVVAV